MSTNTDAPQELPFLVYFVSTFENLETALNKFVENRDWKVFQVVGGGVAGVRDRIILRAKRIDAKLPKTGWYDE